MREKELIYFSERKNDQGLKAVHPLQGRSNTKEEYGTRTQDSKSYPYKLKDSRVYKVNILFSYSGKKGEYRIQQHNLAYHKQSKKWLLIKKKNLAANQIYRIMYSSEDLERFYFQYQSEALPHGESLQSFCVKNKVPLTFSHKWFKYIRKK